MITSANLMQNARDSAWYEQYRAKMGAKKFLDYVNKVFVFLGDLPENTPVEISKFVKTENEDLFAKCVSWFVYEKLLPLHFSEDYKYIKKMPDALH